MKKSGFIIRGLYPGLLFNPSFSSGSILALDAPGACISDLFHMKQYHESYYQTASYTPIKDAVRASGVSL